MVENPTGKGRGSSNYEVRQSLSFETPPSKLPPPPTEGKSAAMMSEGVMKEPESALKSMGPVKGVADSSVPGMGEDQLQRALEGELVSFLREQNSKLMNDLELVWKIRRVIVLCPGQKLGHHPWVLWMNNLVHVEEGAVEHHHLEGKVQWFARSP